METTNREALEELAKVRGFYFEAKKRKDLASTARHRARIKRLLGWLETECVEDECRMVKIYDSFTAPKPEVSVVFRVVVKITEDGK
jgi:hypothetical protein